MNKVLIVLCAVVGVAVLVLLTSYALKAMKPSNSNIGVNNLKQLTKENFDLTYKYESQNKWTYTVKGNLPNPCYMVTADGLVRESYPEQVSIQVKVTEPAKDMVCAQVVTPYEKSGEISASEGATFELLVTVQ